MSYHANVYINCQYQFLLITFWIIWKLKKKKKLNPKCICLKTLADGGWISTYRTQFVKPFLSMALLFPNHTICLGFRPLLKLWILFLGCVLVLWEDGHLWWLLQIKRKSHFCLFIFILFFRWKRGGHLLHFCWFGTCQCVCHVWYVSVCMPRSQAPYLLNSQEESSKYFYLPKHCSNK